ncbi:MAG TPA: type I glutamate--ammonia ligase [Nitrososphaera sp.]|nr:type I glutamate--ammonia ligase [Nitrososphaera sp.]
MSLKENSQELPRYNRKGDGSDDIASAKFIQIRYTDVLGRFLAKYAFCGDDDERNLSKILKNGIGLDGSSVKGFATIDESDLLLVPDRSTLRRAPMPDFNMATVIADVYRGYGRGRLERDPRHVSQCVEERLAFEGLVCQVGPEVECFIFDNILFGGREAKIVSVEDEGQSKYPLRRKGGYDAPPFQDSLLELRFEVAEMLEKYHSIRVTNLNHEVASSGQMEINFMHDLLTRAADNVQVYKDVVRGVAKKHNKVANFMPKPVFDESDRSAGDNGSGMHVSVSLWTKSPPSGANAGTAESSNIFYDPSDEYAEFSQAGRYFIGGLLGHSASLAALVAPTVNSYRRMVSGFEAPVYAAWSRGNRSAVLRVPVNEKGSSGSKRIEFRAPDPSANPYLAFSAIVLAGLDGIRKKMDPCEPVNENIYKMSDSRRSSLGIRPLPDSLQGSLDALKDDCGFLKSCFSDELLDAYLSLKEKEVAEAGNGSKEQQFRMYYDV